MELQTNVKTGDLKISAPEAGTTQQVIGDKPKEPEQKQQEKEIPLVTRASQVKIEPQKTSDDVDFDYKELDTIKTPDEAKAFAEKAYKSLQRGYNNKFQELAELRKSLEGTKSVSATWTPERIQNELLRDPTFVDAAQKVAGTQPSDDGSSMLTEADKKMIADAKQAALIAQQQIFGQKKQMQDESLKTKYANYNPQAVDIITSDLLAGKVQATREDLWKVYDYDNAVQRAYELGKSDRQTETKEKINISSPAGYTAVSSEGLQPEQGETNSSYWNRVVTHNLLKASKEKEQLRK